MLSRIFCIVGKSGTGKDTLYKKIIAQENRSLTPVVPYTTRPKRQDETEGINYHFVTNQQMLELEQKQLIIEKREYQTVHGAWSYFTVKFDLLADMDYIIITTLDGVFKLIEYYGSDMIRVVYLYLEDKERLLRCINRESLQKKPNFSEVCRRFLADEMDFNQERMALLDQVYFIDTGQDVEMCMGKVNQILKRG